jgi:hypothetical protein
VKFSEGFVAEYPVAANAVIGVGAAVIINTSTGFAEAGTAAAANQRIVGVATEVVDNTGGANGAKVVTVWKRGIVDATIAGGIAQAQVGAPAYLDGYDASNQRPRVHGTATGRTQIGTVVSVSGSTALIQLTTV